LNQTKPVQPHFNKEKNKVQIQIYANPKPFFFPFSHPSLCPFSLSYSPPPALVLPFLFTWYEFNEPKFYFLLGDMV
jgi:hypothetical protein